MLLSGCVKDEYTRNEVKFKKLLDVTTLEDNKEYKILKNDFQGIKNLNLFSSNIIKNTEIDGSDLLITVLNGAGATTAKIRITDYFLIDGKSLFKYVVGKDANSDVMDDGMHYNCVIDNATIKNNNIYNKYNLNHKYSNSIKLIGTSFADTFDLSDTEGVIKVNGYIINALGGNDTIKGSRLNDTITAGMGDNTIIYDINNFGNDVINLTKGEILNINLTNGVMLSDKPFLQGENKNDLIISTNQGKITLKNYYGKDTGATVYINGENITLVPSLGIITAKNYFEAEAKIKNKYKGSALADNVDASDLSRPINDAKNTGVIISAGFGDDIIECSKYNDTITGEKGRNKLNINLAKGEFGDDVYKLTKGEYLDVYVTKNGIAYVDSNQLNIEVVKNDVVITVYDSEDKRMGSITIKNATKINPEYLIINDTVNIIDNIFSGSSESFNKNVTEKSNKIIGTALGDTVNVSDKSKAYKINTGLGNDSVFFGAYNDTVTAGGGNDTITFDSSVASSEKTIFLSKDEELSIIDTISAGPYEYEYKGKDVTATVNNSSKITKFILKNMAAKNIGATVIINGKSLGCEYIDKPIDVKADSKKTFKGSWLNDKVTLSNALMTPANVIKDSVIKLGGGYNNVEYNATIGAGNNIVNLTKGEKLTISASNSDENPLHYKTTYEYSGKDVVAQTIYNTSNFGLNDTVTSFAFKNLAVRDSGATVEYDNDLIVGADNFADNVKISSMYNKKKNIFTGTWLNDEVELYTDIGGIKNSTIKLGSGYNEIKFNSKFGIQDTVINLTNGENINIDDIYVLQSEDTITAPTLEYSSSNSKDVILSTTYTNGIDSPVESNFIFKNLGTKDIRSYGGDITYEGTSILDSSVNVRYCNGKYIGSRLNDSVILNNDNVSSLASQYNLGSGNDNIDFTGLIKRNDKFGIQTINLTKGEILNLNFTASVSGQITAEANGNDIILHVFKAENVSNYKSEIVSETVSRIKNDEIFDISNYKMTVTRNEKVTDYTLQVVGGDLKWATGMEPAAYIYMEGDEYFYSATTKAGLTYTSTYDINFAANDIFSYSGAYPSGVVTVNNNIALYRSNAKTVWTWDEDSSEYVKKSEEAILSSVAGVEDKANYYQSFAIMPNDKDWNGLMVNANQFVLLTASTSRNTTGNKDKEKELGKIILKNYAKNMLDSEVWLDGIEDDAGNITDSTAINPTGLILNDIPIEIISDKAKITGTYGNDSIVGLNKKTTTVITNYTIDKEGSYIFGNDKIETYNTAKTILQYTSEDKNVKKLSAADFSFDYDEINNQLLIGVDDKIVTTFSAYGKDENINLENLKFIDSFNKKYQFKNYKAIANDIANIDLSKDASNTNNIVYARNNTVITNITDSKMNDIIFGSDVTQNWTYKNGGSDKFVGGVNKDTYNILFNKNTDVGIVDIDKNGILASLDDVLNIEGTSADKLMLFFDVEKSTGAIDSNLVILDKTSYSKAGNFINAYINNKYSGGSIELTNYFSHEAYLDTTNPNNILIKGADEATDYDTNCGIGTGRIEIVNIVNNNVSTHFDIGTLAAKVAANAIEWLNNNGNYDSVMSVIEGGNKQDIQSLLNVYANTNSVS